METKHKINFNVSKVTANIHKFCPCIWEVTEITKYPENINREDG